MIQIKDPIDYCHFKTIEHKKSHKKFLFLRNKRSSPLLKELQTTKIIQNEHDR